MGAERTGHLLELHLRVVDLCLQRHHLVLAFPGCRGYGSHLRLGLGLAMQQVSILRFYGPELLDILVLLHIRRISILQLRKSV